MKKIFRYIILAILALVVAIGAGYGIISKMQQQEVALSERAMLNLEALARGESPPGGCENPPDDGVWCDNRFREVEFPKESTRRTVRTYNYRNLLICTTISYDVEIACFPGGTLLHCHPRVEHRSNSDGIGCP